MSDKSKENDPEEEVEIIRSSTPTSYSDYVRVGKKENGPVILQFLSLTPDCVHENHRTIISPEFTEQLIDNLCEITKYYPTKPRKAAPRKVAKKKASRKKIAIE